MSEMAMTETQLAELFARHGVQPSAAELAYFAAMYPVVRGMVASLYALPEARFEEPALVFDAAPSFADWA